MIMTIEVTKGTFYTIFNSDQFERTEGSELTNKHYYYNEETEHGGIALYNFVSNVTQYYLTDINA